MVFVGFVASQIAIQAVLTCCLNFYSSLIFVSITTLNMLPFKHSHCKFGEVKDPKHHRFRKWNNMHIPIQDMVMDIYLQHKEKSVNGDLSLNDINDRLRKKFQCDPLLTKHDLESLPAIFHSHESRGKYTLMVSVDDICRYSRAQCPYPHDADSPQIYFCETILCEGCSCNKFHFLDYYKCNERVICLLLWMMQNGIGINKAQSDFRDTRINGQFIYEYYLRFHGNKASLRKYLSER